ncbi:MAG: peptidase C39 [Clostridiales bacterium]|nr:peptidase C39 [Clostridiales bacterium]
MKNPLSYQSTEYDCGPTTMLNAINYLFQREEIYPDVIKAITQYTLDCYNTKGEAYKHGTTKVAMGFLSCWLNHFGKVKNWPICCEQILGAHVKIDKGSEITECLKEGGVVVARVMLGCWHYVLLTGIDKDYVMLFDPYYRKRPFKVEGIEIIKDEPCKYNRKIAWKYMNSEGKSDYALGPIDKRECVLMYRKSAKSAPETIEYYI